jgi:hypothetical protein
MEKRVGFLIPMLILTVFIYKTLKSPNKDKNRDLKEVLRERNLN